jgi:tetratricopeptide (TPR) repeat protein
VSRPAVSVVVNAGGTAADLSACLDTLSPGLGVRDEVVCVLPAHREDLRTVLRGRPAVEVLVDRSGDQAARWRAGCTATSRPVVVLLDGDVVLSQHWLDAVLDAMADPDVVAAGPRVHLSSGPQRVADIPADAKTGLRAFRAHARAWREGHAGRVTEADVLGPVCVAVRRDALERAGGPGAELPWERLRAQGRLAVADAALVAHVGGDLCSLLPEAVPDGAPLLSACMIVKDEEDVLAESLAALRPFVDEIVVYDTGSTDRTRDVAREQGARVVEGYWNDHFADARNRAIAHCAGEWVLVVDADEVVTGNAAEARAALTSAPADVRAFLIGVANKVGHGTGVFGRQMARRVFRRNWVVYAGRIHEQGYSRITGAGFVAPELADVTLVHSGYTLLRATDKNKGERNVRLSLLAVEDQDDPAALVHLARSQLFDGKPEETIATCERGLATAPPEQHRTFLRPMVEAYERLGRLAEARQTVGRLRAAGSTAATADELEARIRLAEGDFTGALELIEAIPEGALDDQSITVDESRTAGTAVAALSGLGRWHEAAERIRSSLRQGWLPVTPAKMAEVLAADGSGLAEVALLLPRTSLRSAVLAASEAPAALADELYEALWAAHAAPMILAGAAKAAPWLPLMRALEWSARLRQHGLAEHCTLIALSGNGARTPRDRALAAGIAFEMFADQRAVPMLEAALAALAFGDHGRVVEELQTLAPSLAGRLEPTVPA